MSNSTPEIPSAMASLVGKKDVEALTLNDVMDLDPLQLSDEEMDIIIAETRKSRARWANEERQAKTKGKRTPLSAGQKEQRKANAKSILENLVLDVSSLPEVEK